MNFLGHDSLQPPGDRGRLVLLHQFEVLGFGPLSAVDQTLLDCAAPLGFDIRCGRHLSQSQKVEDYRQSSTLELTLGAKMSSGPANSRRGRQRRGAHPWLSCLKPPTGSQPPGPSFLEGSKPSRACVSQASPDGAVRFGWPRERPSENPSSTRSLIFGWNLVPTSLRRSSCGAAFYAPRIA